MKVIIKNKHEAYWEIYDLVNATWKFPNLPKDKGYSEKGFGESMSDYFVRLLRENNIPNKPYKEEVCEMVHVNYDNFSCVVLHDDGSYTKHDLGTVTRIMEK